MKTPFILAVCAALPAVLISNGAMAQGYVSGAIGVGHISADCTGATSCDNTGTAYKLTGGYRFDGGWAAELGYVSFGKASASDAGTSVELKPRALTLGLAYRMQFSPSWDGSFRLGFARVKTSVSGSVAGVGYGSDSETRTKPYFGLAVGYALSPSTAIELGADFSKGEFAGETGNVRALTIGLRQQF